MYNKLLLSGVLATGILIGFAGGALVSSDHFAARAASTLPPHLLQKAVETNRKAIQKLEKSLKTTKNYAAYANSRRKAHEKRSELRLKSLEFKSRQFSNTISKWNKLPLH